MNQNNNVVSRPAIAANFLAAVLAGGMLVIAAGSASAATGYVGTRVGASHGGVDTGLGSERDGFAGELFGGVRLNDRWAIELGFFGIDSDLGDYADTYVTRTLENHSKTRGTAVSARYELPMGARTRLHFRAGLTDMDLDYRQRYDYAYPAGGSDVIEGSGRLELSSNSVGTVLAIGVDTALDEVWSIGAELQQYGGDMRMQQHDHGGYTELALDGHGSVQTAVLSLTANF